MEIPIENRWFLGCIYDCFQTAFALKEKPFAIQIADSGFYIRAVGFLLFGVFALGYSSWKAKIKRESKV